MANSVKIPGSANAVNVPPEAVVDTSAWELVKEFDFTDQGAHTFSDNGTHSINSITWTARNQTRSSSFELKSGGGGLEIGSSSSQLTNRWYSTVQNGPALVADLSSIVSGYDLNDTLVLQCLMTAEATTIQSDGDEASQYLFAGILATDGGYGNSGGGNWITSSWYRRLSATTNYFYSRGGGGSTSGAGDNDAQADTGAGAATFLELVLYPAAAFSTAGSLDTSFQDPVTATGGRFFGSMQTVLPQNIGSTGTTSPGANPAFTLRPANLHCGLYFSYLTTGGNRGSAGKVTFTKFRVLKRK